MRLRISLPWVLVVALGSTLAQSNAFAVNTVPDLGDAAAYAVLAFQNTGADAPDLSLTATSTITGDAGVGPTAGSYTHSAGASVSGSVKLAAGTTGDTSDANVVQPFDLSSAITDALAAATAIGGLTPTQVFGDITGGTGTISGGSPDNINVISATKIALSGSDSLTLSGDADDYFIFVLSDSLVASGSSHIDVSGGVVGSHVLYFVSKNAPGSDVIDITGLGTLDGTLFAPKGDIKLHGVLQNGALIGNDVNLGSGGKLSYLPFTPPGEEPPPPVIPEPSSLLLMGTGLVAVGFRSRRKTA